MIAWAIGLGVMSGFVATSGDRPRTALFLTPFSWIESRPAVDRAVAPADDLRALAMTDAGRERSIEHRQLASAFWIRHPAVVPIVGTRSPSVAAGGRSLAAAKAQPFFYLRVAPSGMRGTSATGW